jgi:1-acyl-sn-glycerol-3-phosphate acyltransferase
MTTDDPQERANDDQTTLIEVIESLLRELHRGDTTPIRVDIDSSLERDLGLDSLARLELFARLERQFGWAVPDRIFAEAETPRDILRALSRKRAPEIPLGQPDIPAPQAPESAGLPQQASTLIETLQWHVRQHPQRPHIQFYTDKGDGEVITYEQLLDGAQAMAAGLQQLGLEPGDAICIMLPTSREYFFSFFGILLAGSIPVPIYPPTRPSQLEDHLRRHTGILANCRAVSLITINEAKPVAMLLKAQLDTLQHIVTVDDLLTAKELFAAPIISPQDTAFLQYTSGSTGSPKGVVLTHANLLANIRAMGERVQASASDVFVSWLPLYHDMGLIGAWLGSLYYAALFVVMSPMAFLAQPQRWLQAIHHYRGTLSAAPNFGYELCLHRLEDEQLQGLDLSSWRAAFNGAEAVSPETVVQFPERFGPFGFRADAMMPVYGLAECSVGLAFPPLDQGVRIDHIQRKAFMLTGKAIPAEQDDPNALRFVACGQVLAGHEIRIADPQGNELPEREEGRLQFRGPSATSGYLRNPEATARLFDGDWLDTGDLGYLSAGDLYVTGRIKDIIIRAGRNLYPHELEEAVGDLPDIRKGRVAVFGATDPKSGTERLVVLAETRVRDSDVHQQMRTRINNISSELCGAPPDDIVLAPPNTVLKTSSGKIRRSACRELYESGFLGKAQPPVWRQVSRLVLASLVPQWRRLRRNVSRRLWSLYSALMFWWLAPLTWLLVVLAPIRSWRWRVMQLATQSLARLTANPIQVEGRERLPSPEQPVIYVANHASYLDGPCFIAALQRPFSFVAKEELGHQLIAGTFLRRIEAEFVERFDVQKGISDTQRIVTSARQGRSLFFFPEGTFTRAPGVRPFHLGAFLTAAESGLPVVPIAVRGSRSVLRSGSKLPQRGRISISIGRMLSVDEISEQLSREQKPVDVWNIALALREKARQHILMHSAEPDLNLDYRHIETENP